MIISFAQDHYTAQVNVRNENGKIEAKNLPIPRILENSFFKVVHGENHESINLDTIDESIKLRAATVFYHMNIAKKFFDKLDEISDLNEKVTLRVDQTKLYDPINHYHTDSKSLFPLLGATSLKSNLSPPDDVEPWGKETFFYKANTIKVKSDLEVMGNLTDKAAIKQNIRNSLLTQNGIEIAADYVRKGYLDIYDFQIHSNAVLLSIVIPEVVPKLFKGIGKLYKRKVKIDTAMIPEIIYHEYTHHRLHHIFGTSGSGLDEGYANYFAYKISGLVELGGKAKGSIKGSAAKRPNLKRKFSYLEELRSQKHLSGEFVYTLLYYLEKSFDNVVEGSGEKIIINSLIKNRFGFYHMTKHSRIKDDFSAAIYKGIKAYTNDFEKQLLLNQTARNIFTQLGI